MAADERERLLYRPAEVGELIGVSRARAYELIASRVIPSIRIGSSIRVPAEGLRRWIEEQTTAAAAEATEARRA